MQRAHILPLPLHPGLAHIQCALEEAAVGAVVQQSCSPVGQDSIPGPVEDCAWQRELIMPRGTPASLTFTELSRN